MSSDRVLSLSMRPKLLEDCVGQEEIVIGLENQFSSGRIPHFYILHGPIGSGKTTFARILAMALQLGPKPVSPFAIPPETWAQYKKYDIKEINAANQNGVDDIRSLVESVRYMPIHPSKAKVIILDEAHQLTTAAQNALLTETEDVAKHVYYIFCTSNLEKIIPALKRRAYLMNPKALTTDDIYELCKKAAEFSDFEGEVMPLYEALVIHSISSPGLVLQACEKFFTGISAMESVTNFATGKFDSLAVCKSVAKGDWKECSKLLKDITKEEVVMMKLSILGYLKAILMKSDGVRAGKLARAIRILADENDILARFMANLYLTCEAMGAN